MNLFNLGLLWIKEQTENIEGISLNVGVQSITPQCNDISTEKKSKKGRKSKKTVCTTDQL